MRLRSFDKRDKMATYSKQGGICPICGQHFEYEEIEEDHIQPWSKGGHTTRTSVKCYAKIAITKRWTKY